MRLGGGKQPYGTLLRIRGQLRRPGQERGLDGVAAALLRPRSGVFQVYCGVLVGDDAGRRAVPRRLVQVPVEPGDDRQCVVDPAPVAGPGPLIDS